jgi:hypothetical protein
MPPQCTAYCTVDLLVAGPVNASKRFRGATSRVPSPSKPEHPLVNLGVVTGTHFGPAGIPSDNPTEAMLLGEFFAVRALANERARHELRGSRHAFLLVLVGFWLLLLAISSQLSFCHFILALVSVRIFLSFKPC